MRLKGLAVSLALLAVTLLAACGGSDNGNSSQATATESPTAAGEQDTSEATPTEAATISDEPISADETEYLHQVRAGFARSEAKFRSFGELIGRVYETRGALFGALREAGAGTAFDPALEALEQLEPPGRFRADHELALEGLRASQLIDREIGQAVEDADIVAFTLGNAQLGVLATQRAFAYSPAFCEAAVSGDPFLAPVCDRDEPLPGGGYGTELYAIIGRFEAEFKPRVIGFPLDLSDEERLEVESLLRPAVVNAVEEARESVRALEPPAELREDHDRLLQYLDELLEVERAISKAVEEQNIDKLEEESDQGGKVFCSALEELSPEIKPIVQIHFLGPPGDPNLLGLCGRF